MFIVSIPGEPNVETITIEEAQAVAAQIVNSYGASAESLELVVYDDFRNVFVPITGVRAPLRLV
jgi:hypothetical protein